MDQICLDRTVRETRDILNEDTQLPKYVKVTRELGAMKSFHFGHSQVELPIEHIGFATLASELARREFSVLVKGKEGEYRHFEMIQHEQGGAIANFLNYLVPDTLNWYKSAKDGTPYQYTYVGSKVLREPTTNYTQCKAVDEQTGVDYRELALTEAYKYAVGDYIQTLTEIGECEENEYFQEAMVDFFNKDMEIFQAGLQQLQQDSMLTIPHTVEANQ